MHQWGSIFIEGAEEMGQTFRVVEDGLQVQGMQEAGFEDIRVVEKKVSSLHPSPNLKRTRACFYELTPGFQSDPHRCLAQGEAASRHR